MTAAAISQNPADPNWSSAFRHPVTVRFYQADPAGILFYGRIFELVADAFEEMVRAAGIDIVALVRLDTLATPIVHAEADYFGPMRVGDHLLVAALVESVGTSSVSMAYRIEGPSGDLRAAAKVVHVWIDARAWRKVPVPDEVRRKLAAFAAS